MSGITENQNLPKTKGFTINHINDKLFQEIVKGIDENATLLSWVAVHDKPHNGFVTDIVGNRENEGKMVGLFPYELKYSIPYSKDIIERKIMIKSKIRSSVVIESFANLISSSKEYQQIFQKYGPKLELGSVEYRELESIKIKDNIIRAIMPDVYWSRIDHDQEIFVFAMEYLEPENVSHYNSLNNIDLWKDDDVLAVLDGLASFHARFYERVSDLPANLRKYIDVTYTERLMTSFPLLEASVVRNGKVGTWTPELQELGDKVLHNLPQICDTLDKAPRTFLHNDVNIMNVCLRKNPLLERPKLCLYDWELCYVGPPQQDIALFFCYLFPRNTKIEKWQYFVKEYYNLLVKYLNQEKQCDVPIPAFVDFQKVFDMCVIESLINRNNWGPAVGGDVFKLDFLLRVVDNALQYIKHVWEKYDFK